MVWRINIDVPEEARNISLDNAEDRWWEQVDLTKLILASNSLVSISEDIHQLPALTVLDVCVKLGLSRGVLPNCLFVFSLLH